MSSSHLAVPKNEKITVKLSDLKHEFVTFRELDEDKQKKVVRDYILGWKPVLDEEARVGVIKTPYEDEVWRQFTSEAYKKHFHRGQMVLMAEIEGSWEPIRSIRSVIWRIPERKTLKPSDWEGTEYGEQWYPEDQMLEIRIEKCPECYPKTWYEASNRGYGYTTIKMIENREIKDYQGTDYERVQNSSREENRRHKLVLINYAVTSGGSLPDDIKIGGATKTIIRERGNFAEELGLGCDTYTPASGFAEWLSRLKISEEEFMQNEEFFVKSHIDRNVLSAAAKGTRSDIFDAATMHLMMGANFVGYVKNARHDPRSKNYCIITSYLE